VPLASAAGALVSHKAWFAFGYRNAEDFAREQLRRSGRWLRDLQHLHVGLEAFPQLADALCGADGQAPIGPKAALSVAGVATQESVSRWIHRARKLSLRDLRQAIVEANSPSVQDSANAVVDSPGPMQHVPVRFRGPPELKLALDAMKSLHTAIVGSEQGTRAFVEAMLGEAVCDGEGMALDGFHSRMQQRLRRTTTENVDRGPSTPGQGMAESRRAMGSMEPLAFSPRLRRAQNRLDEFQRLRCYLARLVPALRPEGEVAARNRRLRHLLAVFKSLIRLQDNLEIALAELLLEMHECRAWKLLGHAGLEAYAEARLGLGRSTARRRVSLARRLRRHARTRQSYECGRLGEEAAQWVVRRLERGEVAPKSARPGESALRPETEEHVIAHAASTTIKRLRDEERLFRREELLRCIDAAQAMTARRAPLGVGEKPGRKPETNHERWVCTSLPNDAAWHASLVRRPGRTWKWILELEHGLLDRVVRRGPLLDVTVLLSLEPDVAAALLSCIEAIRRKLCHVHTGTLVEESRLRPSARLARQMNERGEFLPTWLGLLGLLEECVFVWDDPRGMPRRPHDPIYQRDGFRCMAPGCTARARLETHHLVYRSQGGSEVPENLIVLCRFHHQQGEHGLLAQARGRAPLRVTWQLGARELATWWRNERRLRQLPGRT
jgi:hypothetical protein